MPKPAAVAGATLMCPFGAAPSTLMVTDPRVQIEGRPAAAVTDKAPMVNIPSFGMCCSLANPAVASATAAALGVLTPQPCTPVPVSPWTPGGPTTMVRGAPALGAGSTINCAFGGIISVVNPGTTTTTEG